MAGRPKSRARNQAARAVKEAVSGPKEKRRWVDFAVTPLTDAKRRAFLSALMEMPNVSRACRLVNVSKTTVYKLRKADPQFALDWDEALDAGVDNLEEAAYERASETSDILAMFLLKGYRPEKFRERYDHTSGGQPLGQPRITEIIINLPVSVPKATEIEVAAVEIAETAMALSDELTALASEVKESDAT